MAVWRKGSGKRPEPFHALATKFPMMAYRAGRHADWMRHDVGPATTGRNLGGRSDNKVADCRFSSGSGSPRGDDLNGAPSYPSTSGMCGGYAEKPIHSCVGTASEHAVRKRTSDSSTIIPF